MIVVVVGFFVVGVVGVVGGFFVMGGFVVMVIIMIVMIIMLVVVAFYGRGRMAVVVEVVMYLHVEVTQFHIVAESASQGYEAPGLIDLTLLWITLF
jgi:hypothetical protein